MTTYQYQIGTTLDGMQSLTDLGIDAPPHPSFRPFSTSTELANKKLQGNGYPVATWHWDVMKPGWSDTLASYLDTGNLSGSVYIRTRQNRLTDDDYTWATYECEMKWVTGDEDVQSKRSVGLTIEFTHMIFIPDDTGV